MFVCDKLDRAITCMLCRDLHLALMFSCFYKKICLKESDQFGEKLFQTKLLSRLSHKVCRHLSSPVLLRKFTIKIRTATATRTQRKSNRIRLTKQQLSTWITLFCTFLCRRCTTMTWNCLISRFEEDVNTRRPPSFSFPEPRYSPLEFNSRKIRQHLTKWTRWNKRDKVSTRTHFLRDVFVAVALVVTQRN